MSKRKFHLPSSLKRKGHSDSESEKPSLFLQILNSSPAFKEILRNLPLADWLTLRALNTKAKSEVEHAFKTLEIVTMRSFLTEKWREDVRVNEKAVVWLGRYAPHLKILDLSVHLSPHHFTAFSELETVSVHFSADNYCADLQAFHNLLCLNDHLKLVSVSGALPPTSDALFGYSLYPEKLRVLDCSRVSSGDFRRLLVLDSWLTPSAIAKLELLEEFRFPKDSYLGLTSDLLSLGRLPRLSRLVMPSYYGEVGDGFQSPVPDNFCHALLSLKSLRSLTFPQYNYEKYTLKPFFDRAKTLKHLESLSILNSGRGGLLFFNFVSPIKSLRHFELGYQSKWDCSDIHLLSHLVNLRSLTLRGFHWKAEFSHFADTLNQHFPHLKLLKLEIGSGKFKEFGASATVHINRSLEEFHLNTSHCNVNVRFDCGPLLKASLVRFKLLGPPKMVAKPVFPTDYFKVDNLGPGLIFDCEKLKVFDLSDYENAEDLTTDIAAKLNPQVKVYRKTF